MPNRLAMVTQADYRRAAKGGLEAARDTGFTIASFEVNARTASVRFYREGFSPPSATPIEVLDGRTGDSCDEVFA